MNEVTQCAGPVSTNAGLISCAGVTGSGCITYHAYATLLSGLKMSPILALRCFELYNHVHVRVHAICTALLYDNYSALCFLPVSLTCTRLRRIKVYTSIHVHGLASSQVLLSRAGLNVLTLNHVENRRGEPG